MNRTKRLCLATLLLVLTQGAIANGASERIGRALHNASGQLLYEEHHQQVLQNGEVVVDEVSYRDPQGRIFATKRVDFASHPTMPEFELNNQRTGHIEGLRRIDARSVEVSFRENSSSALQRVRLEPPADAVADAGFDRFIDRHWDALFAGKTLTLAFLVPGRLEFMNFRIKRAEDNDSRGEGSNAQKHNTARFELDIDSALLRLIVPTLTVVYDRTSRRLLHYEGLSNLRGDDGDNLAVRIDFQYAGQQANPPATVQRATRTSQDLVAAQQDGVR